MSIPNYLALHSAGAAFMLACYFYAIERHGAELITDYDTEMEEWISLKNWVKLNAVALILLWPLMVLIAIYRRIQK